MEKAKKQKLGLIKLDTDNITWESLVKYIILLQSINFTDQAGLMNDFRRVSQPIIKSWHKKNDHRQQRKYLLFKYNILMKPAKQLDQCFHDFL